MRCAIRKSAPPEGERARAGLERLARGFWAYYFAGALFDGEVVGFALLTELADLALLDAAFFFEEAPFL
jgi:hypothetical protein